MHDPLSRGALARIRRLLRVLRDHEVDLDDVTLVTVAGVVLAVEAHSYREPLVTHSVPGAGPDAAWPLSWTEGYVILGILLPLTARLDSSETPGAIPVLVIEGNTAELTFLMLDDIEVRS